MVCVTQCVYNIMCAFFFMAVVRGVRVARRACVGCCGVFSGFAGDGLWLFEIIYIIRYFFNSFLVMARRVRRGVVRGVLSLPWGDGTGQVVELTGGSGGLWYCDGGLWLGGFPRGRRFCAYVGSEGFEKRVLGGRFSESFWSIGSSVRGASAGVGSEGVVYFRSGMFGVLLGVSGFSLSDSVVVRGTGDSLVPGRFNVVIGNTFDWEFVRFALDGDVLSVVLRTTGSNDGSGDVGFCDVSLWCPLVLGGGLGFRDSVVGRLYQGGSVVSGCSVVYGGYRVLGLDGSVLEDVPAVSGGGLLSELSSVWGVGFGLVGVGDVLDGFLEVYGLRLRVYGTSGGFVDYLLDDMSSPCVLSWSFGGGVSEVLDGAGGVVPGGVSLGGFSLVGSGSDVVLRSSFSVSWGDGLCQFGGGRLVLGGSYAGRLVDGGSLSGVSSGSFSLGLSWGSNADALEDVRRYEVNGEVVGGGGFIGLGLLLSSGLLSPVLDGVYRTRLLCVCVYRRVMPAGGVLSGRYGLGVGVSGDVPLGGGFGSRVRYVVGDGVGGAYGFVADGGSWYLSCDGFEHVGDVRYGGAYGFGVEVDVDGVWVSVGVLGVLKGGFGLSGLAQVGSLSSGVVSRGFVCQLQGRSGGGYLLSRDAGSVRLVLSGSVSLELPLGGGFERVVYRPYSVSEGGLGVGDRVSLSSVGGVSEFVGSLDTYYSYSLSSFEGMLTGVYVGGGVVELEGFSGVRMPVSGDVFRVTIRLDNSSIAPVDVSSSVGCVIGSWGGPVPSWCGLGSGLVFIFG